MTLIPIACLLTGLIQSSCDNETPTSCPRYEVGVVEGYLLACGQGVSALVGARAQEGPRRGDVIGWTMSDTAGWYRLELPAGLYRLEADPRSGTVTSSNMRDTVRVAARVHRHDLLRGRAEIEIGVPDELNDGRFALTIYGHQYWHNARADAVAQDGSVRFVFPVLPPQAYEMMLNYQEQTGWLYLPDALDSSGADTLFVDTDNISTYMSDFAASYATISGNVTGSWQQTQSVTTCVDVMASETKRVCRKCCTPDGAFTCGILVAQPVRLRVDCDDVERWVGGNSFETARVFDLQPGDRITDVAVIESGIEVWLEGPGDLTVHRPFALVRDEAGNEFIPHVYTENPFVICNLRPGRHFLYVDGYCDNEIWTAQWYDGAGTLAEATPIDLAEGELRHVEIELVEGGRIAGEVLTSDGQRPEYAICAALDSRGEFLCSEYRKWRDCPNGVFNFRGLADGTYYLATRYGYDERWWYPGTLDFAEATPITIAGHDAVTGITWLLPDPGKGVGP